MAAATGKTNWFAVWVSIAVVVVLVGLGGFVVFLNTQAAAPGEAPTAETVDTETGAITFGSGDTVVDTYIDFMCPACNAFENKFGDDLREGAFNGDITLNVHPIAILNNLSQGTSYSSRAGSAMYCVAENAPDAALDFMAAMFKNQPAEGTAGLTDEEIIGIAEQSGASSAAECITDGTYMDFVEDRTPETPQGERGISTPTVVIDGEYIINPINGTDVAQLVASFGN